MIILPAATDLEERMPPVRETALREIVRVMVTPRARETAPMENGHAKGINLVKVATDLGMETRLVMETGPKGIGPVKEMRHAKGIDLSAAADSRDHSSSGCSMRTTIVS